MSATSMSLHQPITAAEMAELLIARIRDRRDMRAKMPGDVNETLTLELATMVHSLNELAKAALDEPVQS